MNWLNGFGCGIYAMGIVIAIRTGNPAILAIAASIGFACSEISRKEW
jgi:hypothetical protein